MIEVMQAVGHVAKTRKNTQQGYTFRGIDDLYDALQAPLCAAGVFCAPTVTCREVVERQTKNGGSLIYTTLTVMHRFYATDGSYVDATTVGEAMDSGDKSSNKAMSAALKYAFLEVFCIPTEGENDSEAQTHEVAARPQGAPVYPAQGTTGQVVGMSTEEIERARSAPSLAQAQATGLTKGTPLSDAGNIGPAACEEQTERLRELGGDEFARAVWRSPEPASMPERHKLLKAAADAIQTIDSERGVTAHAIIGATLRNAGWVGGETTDKPTVRAAVAALVKIASEGIPF